MHFLLIYWVFFNPQLVETDLLILILLVTLLKPKIHKETDKES